MTTPSGKSLKNQSSERREPRQERARYKLELILDAAIQLLEQRNIATLTTNAIAEKAGVSIGTLYQYFADKEAILDALVQRELKDMSAGIMAALQQEDEKAEPGWRLRKVLAAIRQSYGQSSRVHGQLLMYSLSHGPGTRLHPLHAGVMQLLTQGNLSSTGLPRVVSPEEAFVMTHAIAGVMRGLVTSADIDVQPKAAEEALVRLVLNFLPQSSTNKSSQESLQD